MNINQVIVVGKLTMACVKGDKPFIVVNTEGVEVRIDFNFKEEAISTIKPGSIVGVKGQIRWDGSSNGYWFMGEKLTFIAEKQKEDGDVS